MKKIMLLAIPALFLTFTVVKIAYSWSIYQGAGFTNSGSAPRTYADAYSSTYGLTDGAWEVYAKVNHQGPKRNGVFAQGGAVFTAHKHEDNADLHAYAYSQVEGWPTNGGDYVDVSDDEEHIP